MSEAEQHEAATSSQLRSGVNTPRCFSGAIRPERHERLSGFVLVSSFVVHGSLAWVLQVNAAEPARVHAPRQIAIELAPPPPPAPVEEPEPEIAEPAVQPEQGTPPPPQRVKTPRPAVTQAQTSQAQPAAIGAGIPAGDEGTLPPAPEGTAPPGPVERVAAPPPPPPPPPSPLPVVQAREGANYLNNPRPSYPRTALRQGWEGKVVLRVRVLPDGKVLSAQVVQSAGRSVLDEAALDIVKGWTFVPATQGGKPVAGWVSVPFEFRIQE